MLTECLLLNIWPLESTHCHGRKVKEIQEEAAGEAQEPGWNHKGTRGWVFQLWGCWSACLLQEAGLPKSLPCRLSQSNQATSRLVPKSVKSVPCSQPEFSKLSGLPMHRMHSTEGIWVHVLPLGVNNKGLEPYIFREGNRNSLAIYQVLYVSVMLFYSPNNP